MVKFTLKSFLLVLLIGFLCSYVTDYIFDNDNFYKTLVKEYKTQESIDILLLGSSHAHSSYDPRVLERGNTLNFFNLGGSGQRLTTTQVVADMVLKDHKPSLVIIDLFSVSFNEPDNETYKGLQLQTLDFLPMSSIKFRKLREIFGESNLLEAISPTIRNHTKWKSTKRAYESAPMTYRTIDVYKGFRTNNLEFTEKVWNEFKIKYESRNAPVKRTELLEIEKVRIDEIVAIFEEKGIPILFVNAPSYITIFESKYRAYSKFIKQYIEEIGYTIIDYNLLFEELGLEKHHFKDPNHLNTRGAIIVSEHLKNYLNKTHITYDKPLEKEYLNNRYYHIDTNFKRTLYSQEMDSAQTNKTYGIKSAHVYRVSDTRYEIIMPLERDSLNAQPARIEYDISSGDYRDYHLKTTSFNKKNSQATLYGDLDNRSVITYKNNNYAVYPFNSTLKSFSNFKFYAGDKRKVQVLSAKRIETSD